MSQTETITPQEAAAAIPDHAIALLAVADKIRELQEAAGALAEQVDIIRTAVFAEPTRTPAGYFDAIMERVENFDLAAFCEQADDAHFARLAAARASAA